MSLANCWFQSSDDRHQNQTADRSCLCSRRLQELQTEIAVRDRKIQGLEDLLSVRGRPGYKLVTNHDAIKMDSNLVFSLEEL